MDNKICDVKTCDNIMTVSEAIVFRIGNKEYDFCKDYFTIFSKWLEETFANGKDIPITIPWQITDGTADSNMGPLWWPYQLNPIPVDYKDNLNPYPQITWCATDSKDMQNNWENYNANYKRNK